jgi:anti-sigma B factor antagonist
MSDEFQITSLPARDGVVLLRINGRVDTKTASEMLQQCTAARRAGQHLVINLSGVGFIASSGIGALLALTEQFREGPGRIRFTSLSPAVAAVIQLLNLDQFLSIDSSEEQSLQALEREAA